MFKEENIFHTNAKLYIAKCLVYNSMLRYIATRYFTYISPVIDRDNTIDPRRFPEIYAYYFTSFEILTIFL